ncbi:MAG TPA: fibronectin type III domain-containing protein [Planctomycetota bacterium]|nr:fibronectin type III domain-containing protein [Planctomycetota bacterium]
MSARNACVAVAVMLLGAGVAVAQDARIGASEEFNSPVPNEREGMAGWKVTRNTFASLTSENGRGVFETHIENLPAEVNGTPVTADTFLKLWKPGQPRPKYTARSFKGKAGAIRELGVVDLDRFRYLVVKVDWRPLGAEMELKIEDPATGRGRNWPVQVLHSSGVIAQDLKPFGIAGKQKVSAYIEVFPTGRKLKLDYIRLVSELTDEERAGLIPAPITLPEEKLERHPYMKLETLYRRSTRPWTNLPASAEEQALFRDVGTHVPTWRMTGTPAHEGLNGTNKPWVWRDDGSSMSTPGRTYYFDKQTWGKETMRTWSGREVAAGRYRIERDKARNAYIFKDTAGGQDKVIYEYVVPEGARIHSYEEGIYGNRLVAGLIGHKVLVVDADPDGGKPTVKMWPLPDIDAKGMWSNEKYLSYWAPFLSLHRLMVDLDTGVITKGTHPTMTHGMGGRDWRIMSYDGISKVLISHEGGLSPTPGKGITVYGVYKTYVSTDYGEMTSDYRYGITNGTKGELDEQYVLFDRLDAGTVLRLCTYNVSYETWDLRAKVAASPDYTKLIYASDFLGDADFYMTIVRLPSAPTDVKLTGSTLSWNAPVPNAEIKHYNIYRSQESGGPYERIATTKETIFTDREKIASPCYLVTAEEHSGLESYFSDEVRSAGYEGPVTLHFGAENLAKTAPFRDVVDGAAGGFRAVRVTPVREDETEGTLRVPASSAGRYQLWVRAKHWNGGKGKLSFLPEGTRPEAPAVAIASADWSWVRCGTGLSLRPGQAVRLGSSDAGVAIDEIVLTTDPNYEPRSIDDRVPAPQPVTGLQVTKTDANSVELKWDASPAKNIAFYSVYVSDKSPQNRAGQADFRASNETLLCSTHDPVALDWGTRPGTTYTYRVVAVDQRWQESPPVDVKAQTKPLEVVTKHIPAAQATASAGLKRDGDYVEYAGKAAGEQSLTFDFDLPADGTYYVWMKYTPTFNQEYRYDNIGLILDGAKMERYGPHPRPPRGWKEGRPLRWFVEHLVENTSLKAGRHSVKLLFQEKDGIRTLMGQRIAGIWVTNDASVVPPGSVWQVRFEKPASW